MSKGEEPPVDLNSRLLDLVHDALAAADLEGVLAAVLDAARDLVAADGVSVMWLDEDHLRVLASAGVTAAPPGLTLPISQMGAARPIVDAARPLLVLDTLEEVLWQRVPGEERVRSWLGVPLLLEDRPLGLLEWTGQAPEQFTQADVAVGSQIAWHAAPILHRAQLLDDMRRRLRELLELQSAPVTAVDPAIELQTVVLEARESTETAHAFIFLLDEETSQVHCAAASGDERERLRKTVLKGDGTFGGWKLPVQRSAARRGGRLADRDAMAALGIRDPLLFPLRVRGKAVGMLGVAGRRDGRAFDSDCVQILVHLAGQAAVILERSPLRKPEPAQYNYELMVRSSPLAVGVLTLTGEIQYCNPGLTELLSGSSRTLVGRNLTDLMVPSDGRRLGNAMEEVTVTGQRRQVDVRMRTALGEDRHVRISVALGRATDDAGGSLVVTLEDVTALKILEAERVEHLSELKEKHNQLRELDQLKSRFVSNVSHELRTPLAVIKLYATLARKGRPEKQPHYLQTIEHETHRLETMVENVLDLTRLDRGALQVHSELIEVGDVVVQILEIYQETASKREIELSHNVADNLSQLWADRNHVIQMLTNLVDNALRYTPRGGRVWVTAREFESASRPWLEIAVCDTGAGVAEEEQAKLFERFYRGSNNPPGSTGTGLGLAIVQELMAQHGGKVMLESRVGEGSRFGLQFPLDREREAS